MPRLKQNWMKVVLGILILGTLFFIVRWSNWNRNAPGLIESSVVSESPVAGTSSLASLQELHDKAHKLIQEKDYPEALKNAETAVKIDQNYIDAYVDQGIALYSMGRCVEGAASLYHASILDPTDETISAILSSMLNQCKEAENKTK